MKHVMVRRLHCQALWCALSARGVVTWTGASVQQLPPADVLTLACPLEAWIAEAREEKTMEGTKRT